MRVYNPFLHEPVDFGEGLWVHGNPTVLLTFLSDRAPVTEDKFAGDPARIFPCHKGNDEEL